MPKLGARRLVAMLAGVALAIPVGLVAAGSAAAVPTDPTLDRPGNVQATDVHAEGFTITWDALDGAVEYIVRVRKDGTGHGSYQVTRETSATFGNLAWESDYDVSVKALIGGIPAYTEFSEPVWVSTPLPEGFEPPGAPTNLRVVHDADGFAAFIEMDPPEQGTGRLTLTLHAEGVGPISWGPSADLWELLFISCVLEPGETYTFFATATDRAGNVSPPSESITVTMPPWSWF